MRTIHRYPLAEQDLIDIWLHGYSNWGSAQADRYLAALDQQIQRLAENPEICRIHLEFLPPVRICHCGSHLIIYTTDDTSIAIIRVLHRRMELESHL